MRAAQLFPTVALAALPAFAGTEIGLLLDRQTTKAHSVQVSQTSVNGSYDAGSLSGAWASWPSA